MHMDTSANTMAKAVVIIMIPVWSVAVTTASGASWPGKRPAVELESIAVIEGRGKKQIDQVI